MLRKPTFAGKIQTKDERDILFWAFKKSSEERLKESWRLNCINHGIPIESRLDKEAFSAKKRK